MVEFVKKHQKQAKVVFSNMFNHGTNPSTITETIFKHFGTTPCSWKRFFSATKNAVPSGKLTWQWKIPIAMLVCRRVAESLVPPKIPHLYEVTMTSDFRTPRGEFRTPFFQTEICRHWKQRRSFTKKLVGHVFVIICREISY